MAEQAVDLVMYIVPAAALSAALWIVSLVGWMIIDEIGIVEGVCGIAIVFGALVVAIRTEDIVLSIGAISSLLVAAILLPFVKKGLHDRAHQKIDLEMMRDAYRMLEARPDNIGAKLQLAEMCRRSRLYDSSVALFVEGGRSFDARREARSENACNRCRKCGTKNKVAELYCIKCGDMILVSLGARSYGADLALRLLSLWSIAVAAFILLPAATSLLAPPVAALAVVALMLLSFAFAVRIIRVGLA